MILKIGTILLMSASCVMLTVGCQQQTDEVVKKDAVKKGSMLQPNSKPVTNAENAMYREVSINVTGMT